VKRFKAGVPVAELVVRDYPYGCSLNDSAASGVGCETEVIMSTRIHSCSPSLTSTGAVAV